MRGENKPPPWETKEDVPWHHWRGSEILDPQWSDEERLRELNERYYYNGARADAEARQRKKDRTALNGQGSKILCAADHCTVLIPKERYRAGEKLCHRCKDRIMREGQVGHIRYVGEEPCGAT